MSTSIDTTISSLGITLEELYEKSAEEREALYKEAMRDLSDEDLAALEEEFKEKMEYLADELYVLQSELEAILSSGDSSAEEIARAERALEDIDALFEFADEESSNFGSAQTELAEENVDATNGEDYSFTPTDPSEGQEYVIDATATTASEDESTGLGEEYDENYGDAAYVDHDGDSGTALIEADTDGDGRADVDTNSDGEITELDMLDYDEQPSNQDISLNVDGTVELASYDSDTGDTRWKVTTEDGVTYYVTVKGSPNIRFTGDYTMAGENIDTSWDPELLSRCYDGLSSESFGEVMGVGYSNPEVDEYYTIYNMADQTDNELDLNLDDAQAYAEGREYVVTMDEDYTTQDTINLTFPDDAELSFEQEDDGDIIITATLEDGGEITVRIENYGGNYSSDSDYIYDVINISGGIIDESDCEDIKSMTVPYIYEGTEYETTMWGVSYYAQNYSADSQENGYAGGMTYNDEQIYYYGYTEYGMSRY